VPGVAFRVPFVGETSRADVLDDRSHDRCGFDQTSFWGATRYVANERAAHSREVLDNAARL
jgi:hypothetical protein